MRGNKTKYLIQIFLAIYSLPDPTHTKQQGGNVVSTLRSTQTDSTMESQLRQTTGSGEVGNITPWESCSTDKCFLTDL